MPPYGTLAQKAVDAVKFKREDDIPYPVAFDDLQGMVHQVYGGLADPTYLIDSDGRVAFYNLWTHAPTLHEAIEELLAQDGRGVVKGGVHRAPHLASAMTDGWRGLRRGLWQSFIELELAAPGSASMPWLGYQLKPLLAPVTLRARPLPVPAKLGLAAGGIALLALGGKAASSLIYGRDHKLRKGEDEKMNLKNINEQVMVITGATSGIGLTTARTAAESGAKVFLIARNEQALRELTDEINNNGGRAAYFAADVADENAIREAARRAIDEFGRIDTWVNNAGASIYGRLMDVSTDDLRRVIETNFWGVLFGSRIAADHMRDNGGAIINVGSELSDASVPLQGIYSASKHAVKGITDALRMELEADGFPISITLIKPTATHTPFTENAKNYLPYEPQLPGPVYAPDLVAEAILHCAENPTRDFFVGEMAKLHSAMAMNAPRLYDMFNESMIDTMQNSGEPSPIDRRDGLHQTNSDLRERGSEDRFVLETSVYQKARMHPLITAGLLAGGSLAVAAYLNSKKTRSDGPIPRLGEQRDREMKSPFPAGSPVDTRSRQNTGYPVSTGSQLNAGLPLNISEQMEVIGSDGQHVGTVDRVEGDEIKLTRDDSPDGRHHLVSLRNVEMVDGGRVKLSKPANEVKANWQTA